jgi:photosystem II stability/assembly factor-like uncharacterized protein
MKMWNIWAVLLTAICTGFAQWRALSRTGEWAVSEVAFTDSVEGWAIDRFRVLRTTDRGWSWTVDISLPCESEYRNVGLAVVDPNHIYLSYQWIYIPHYVSWKVWVKARVHGVWQSLFVKLGSGMYEYCTAGRLSFPDTLHGWHLGYGNDVLETCVRTENGGTSWEYVSRYPHDCPRDVCFVDSLTGWAAWQKLDAFGMTVRRTTDGGDSWQIQTGNIVALRVLMAGS